MSLGIINSIGEIISLNNRRFLVGIFFPSFLGIMSSLIILFKFSITDLELYTLIILFTFLYSIMENDIGFRLNWKLNFTGFRYKRFMKKNIQTLFISPAENLLKEKEVKNETFKMKFIDYLSTFENQAKNEYYNFYFAPERRLEEKRLILEETRFLFLLNVLIFTILDIFLVLYLAQEEIRFGSFVRDRIETLHIFLLVTLILIFFVILANIIVSSMKLWKIIILSTTTPFETPEYEEKYNDFSEILIEYEKDFIKRTKGSLTREELLKSLLNDPRIKIQFNNEFNSFFKNKMRNESIRQFILDNNAELKISTENTDKYIRELFAFRHFQRLDNIPSKMEIEDHFTTVSKELIGFYENNEKNTVNLTYFGLELFKFVGVLLKQITGIEARYIELIRYIKEIDELPEKDQIIEVLRNLNSTRNKIAHESTDEDTIKKELKKIMEKFLKIENLVKNRDLILLNISKERIRKKEPSTTISDDIGLFSILVLLFLGVLVGSTIISNILEILMNSIFLFLILFSIILSIFFLVTKRGLLEL